MFFVFFKADFAFAIFRRCFVVDLFLERTVEQRGIVFSDFSSAVLNFFCVYGIVFTDEGLFCEEANLAAKRALLFKKVSILLRSWLYGKV